MEDQFYRNLSLLIPQDYIKRNELMENHTSLHIGGPADYFVTPTKVEELKEIVCLCKKEKTPYFILGNGSNLLVSDKGYRGVIIKLGEEFASVLVKDNGIITAQSGVLLARLANVAAEHSLTGLEFASGIPGTLGGAVTMNAGAYGGDMKQCLLSVIVMDEAGNVLTLSKEELKLGYRSSLLQKESYVLLEVVMQLSPGDSLQIRSKMNELNSQRREKQPLDQYSAGSTFKRPEGYFTGKLINDAGLRGYQVGGAAVSEKHCGFVINKEHATAKEFLTVVDDVIRIVNEKFGVKLEPEIKFLGDFGECI